MMRTTWISAASVLALIATPALAQTSDSGVPRNPSSPATMAAPRQAQPDPQVSLLKNVFGLGIGLHMIAVEFMGRCVRRGRLRAVRNEWKFWDRRV